MSNFRGLIWGFLFVVNTTSFADDSKISAVRNSAETYQEAAVRSGRAFLPSISSTKEIPVQDAAEEFWEFDPNDVPLWQSQSNPTLDEFSKQFLKIRNQRIYTDDEHPEMARRLAFFYPDDGCHLRAALFNQELEKQGDSRGFKIFVFGNLRVPTRHHPDNEVLWWFHVAPIFRLTEGLFVADPALFPMGPVKLKDWLKHLAPGQDLTRLRMVTCDAYAHTPHSRCIGGSTGMDQGALRQHQSELLHYEWVRQLKLGREPARVLGDFPPWDFL